MALGKNIRKFRLDRKWDLPTLSQKSGVDIGTISALEQRDSERSKFISAFAHAFGVTIRELLDGFEGEPRKPAHADGLTPEAVEVARAWMRLPDLEQRGYAQGIMVDAAMVEVFPELEKAMRAAAVAADPAYHKMTERFSRAREHLKRQLELDLKNDP